MHASKRWVDSFTSWPLGKVPQYRLNWRPCVLRRRCRGYTEKRRFRQTKFEIRLPGSASRSTVILLSGMLRSLLQLTVKISCSCAILTAYDGVGLQRHTFLILTVEGSGQLQVSATLIPVKTSAGPTEQGIGRINAADQESNYESLVVWSLYRLRYLGFSQTVNRFITNLFRTKLLLIILRQPVLVKFIQLKCTYLSPATF